jgi:hypothetical protein
MITMIRTLTLATFLLVVATFKATGGDGTPPSLPTSSCTDFGCAS